MPSAGTRSDLRAGDPAHKLQSTASTTSNFGEMFGTCRNSDTIHLITDPFLLQVHFVWQARHDGWISSFGARDLREEKEEGGST